MVVLGHGAVLDRGVANGLDEGDHSVEFGDGAGGFGEGLSGESGCG